MGQRRTSATSLEARDATWARCRTEPGPYWLLPYARNLPGLLVRVPTPRRKVALGVLIGENRPEVKGGIVIYRTIPTHYRSRAANAGAIGLVIAHLVRDTYVRSR